MSIHKVILKPGKEKSLLKRHPWIFSGAIAQIPSIENGEICSVFSDQGHFLGKGYFHQNNSIAGRLLTFTDEPIAQALCQAIDRAIQLRRALFSHSSTNCFRLINAEGDGIPGLIVDQYDQTLVIQINTCGIQKLKSLIIDLLIQKCQPSAIFEKSISSARSQEGLLEAQGFVYGQAEKNLIVQENGLQFEISLEKGQKTGFFLDQREMRKKIGELSHGKKVLNCFSYTGGFSIYALQSGATQVTSIDCNADALELARANTLLNHLNPSQHTLLQEDVFHFLRHTSERYDLIILDPPAFAKKKGDQIAACSGYKEINRLAFQKLKTPGFLLTCSCSHYINEELFQNIIFQAANEAQCSAQIISKHILAADHPISLNHPEGAYLKSLLLSR